MLNFCRPHLAHAVDDVHRSRPERDQPTGCRVIPLLLTALLASAACSRAAADDAPGPQQRVNRLAKESSPYLLQHAHNPVDWYPWGREVFEKAKQENKPIFLSIGYSSCFWCHVMERKVFENEEIARYMNEHFVNIKVDREERPDVDEIYMLAVQVYFQLAGSNQGGGWPLSMFLTPDGNPIAGGTYFPPEDMPGRPGFMTVMQQLSTAWNQQREAVEQTAGVLAREVRRLSQPALDLTQKQVSMADVDAAVRAVLEQYDPVHGGFDFRAESPDAPKFPVPSRLMLLQGQLALGERSAESMASQLDHTLEKMAAGGIYDHLGGGFHRYSTDREWQVPHFEKMLYDNAQLAEVYAEAWQRTRKEQFRQTAEGVLKFVLASMTHPDGAFYSALDAETDGVEGQYYVWQPEEVRRALSPNGYRYFASAYGLDQPTPFEHGHVLHLVRPVSETARQFGMPASELQSRLERMRQELFNIRQMRQPLRLDDKILTSWNGLMIRAFARSGKILNRPDYVEQASQAALFLLTHLRDRDGRLRRTFRQDRATLDAYLDDYAFLVSGLLALHEATGEDKWLNAARLLTDDQINLFFDQKSGGFYFTAHDHESLIARTKAAYDSVIPSGNSVSIANLTRLAQLTREKVYLEHAQKTVHAFAAQLEQNPGNLAYFALATQQFLMTIGEQSERMQPSPIFSNGTPAPMVRSDASRTVHLTTKDQDEHILVAGFFAQNAATAGGQLALAIEVKLDAPWHINANPATPDFAIPTELRTFDNSPLMLKNVHYPPGKEFRLEGIQEALSVYEGTVVIRGHVQIPATAQGQQAIELELRYQACNDQTCLPPKRIRLSGTVPIVASPEQIQPVNESLFKQD